MQNVDNTDVTADADDFDIDQLIASFRAQQTDIQSIQAALIPIIHKFTGTGEKERKLEAFLIEVIEKTKQ